MRCLKPLKKIDHLFKALPFVFLFMHFADHFLPHKIQGLNYVAQLNTIVIISDARINELQ